nr:phosphatase PAP2 family protein [Kibdelosporangium sp. MJ126-NF4]CEL22241.1 DedA protein [Kibdelosporangium sp. MJ126-NF4]CTQ93023.1 DedA protein [Kibdelosporangium sp. MJ126-NF4]
MWRRDVPDVSADWYRDIAGAGAGSPELVQAVGAFATEAIIGVLAVMFLVLWWRARRQNNSRMALAIVAPAVAVVAYLTSELLKNIWQEDRPCRALGQVATVVACPEYGDWSFPSNHATIAGAAAVGLLLVNRAVGIVGVGLAILAALSRVFVGVHYPHDVLAGLVLGAGIAMVARPLARLTTPVVARVRTWPVGALLLGAVAHDAATIVLPRARR